MLYRCFIYALYYILYYILYRISNANLEANHVRSTFFSWMSCFCIFLKTMKRQPLGMEMGMEMEMA